MADIKILDELTICKIAAGEVIQSPAFVVKELVENSIDAGSSEIVIEIKNAGLSRIAVSDDGAGMSRDGILMALEHHATSKLLNVDDLKKIATYGFRGEALPSIVSISNAEIVSSEDGSKPATSVRIEGGVIKSLSPAAAARGTKISVNNLFYNTPVRKKFMKSESYETAMITETVIRYALAHPEIKFSLYNNDRESFTTRQNSNILSVINDIFPGEISENLTEKVFDGEIHQCGRVSIKAYFAPPHISKPNNRCQYYFVNGRPFRNKSVTHAVMEAFKKHMVPKQYPVLFMFIRMEQQFVDVNIHPTKMEVAFTGEFKLHEAVEKLFADGLSNNASMPTGRIEAPDHSNFERRPQTPGGTTWASGPGRDIEPEYSQADLGLQNVSHFVAQMNREHLSHLNGPQPEAFEPAASKPLMSQAARVVGQIFNAFIVVEDADAVLIIDQHVAAEKVLYERILRSLREKDFNSQSLLIPHIYDLTPSEFQMISGGRELFERYGFDIEVFSNNSVAVRAVPDFIDADAERGIVFEIIASGALASSKIDEEFCRRTAAITSCKGAVKAGKPLNEETIAMLVSDLMKCENPYFCPHGRPIIIKMPLSDILHKFKRSL